MPVLKAEPNHFPATLFQEPNLPEAADRVWWVLHTKPRQEKSLARFLYERQVPFYLPQVERRWPSRGRVLRSFVPLFPGYVFLLGDGGERLAALSTNRVVRSLDVADQARLVNDLHQLYRLITSGAPVTPEERLAPGKCVVIRNGPLAGLKGKILRSATGRRFVVEVDFIQRGASVLLDDFSLAAVEEVEPGT
jgi:transcriptional antiterminator RfaH